MRLDRSISTFTYNEVHQWDAGIKFDPKYQGEKVPTIEELFAEMSGHPERQAYLDLKNIDLKELGRLIDKYHVNHQIIFCHNNQDNCIKMKEIAAGVRTMLWVGGKPEKIKEKFEIILQNGFKGLDQVQFHLNPDAERPNDRWLYEIGEEYVRYAMALTAQYNVQFQVLPYQFDQKDISRLLDMGIDWYATDEPARFMECVKNWRNSQD
jgi:glycerophosphoryl diester phosphodiesterase